jgi:hypothetical protein
MRPTIDSFIQDFKQTSYYKHIFSNPGIIMSYVGGSRLIQADSTLSDFDVVIITDSATKIEDTGIRFRYKDVFTVHFYYHTIDQFLVNTYTTSSRLYGIMQANDLDRSALMYENPLYNEIITRFFRKKNTLSRISMLKYVKNFNRLLTDVSNTNQLDLKYYHKYLYHLCYCYYRIARVEQDTQLVLQAKYCSSEGLDTESIEKIIKKLKTLKSVVDYYTVDDLVAQFELNRLYVLEGKDCA